MLVLRWRWLVLLVLVLPRGSELARNRITTDCLQLYPHAISQNVPGKAIVLRFAGGELTAGAARASSGVSSHLPSQAISHSPSLHPCKSSCGWGLRVHSLQECLAAPDVTQPCHLLDPRCELRHTGFNDLH